ncbi:MAG: carboxypeptidase-like regulatory domain-containing protein, partial [Candidatus Electryonea clarkiae]|nr:carboxypeptidase-like regulatory domain-containing protein [Candidatus Electryonea clarkiae]
MRSAKTVSYRSVFVVMMAIAFMSVYAFADITGTESQDNPAFSNVQVTSFDQNVQKGPVRVAKDYSNYDYSRGYHLELDTPIDVLVAPAEDTFTDNLLGFLTEFDEIDEFGYFDARTGTPTLEALQEWDVVITYANNGYNDRPAMGNVLAEYVEEGGAVILTLFAFYSGWEITGSFSTDGYFPITPAGADFGLGAMDEYDEDHPIMTDVGDVSGYYRGSGALTEGSEEVATYANGSVFVATKEIDGAMVIAINDFVKGEMWTGDMDLVLANAIIFAYEGGGEPDATVEGIITDSETEDPVEGAEISIGRATATSGEDGAFFLEDVVSGEGKRVNIIAEGYFPYSEEHDIDVEENEIDFAIDILSADVTGVVSDEMTEEFLSGATVECIEVETGEVFLEVTTDDTGAYVAPALHHDVTYMIVASMTGYAPSDTEEVTINYENEYTFDFELTPIFERTVRQLQQEQDPETWVTCTGVVTQGTNVTNTEN